MCKYNFLARILVISCLSATAWSAPITDHVSINTSSLPANTSGYLDLVFNGGGSPFQPASVSILNFMTNGVLDPLNVTKTAGVSGQLAGPVSATNQNSEYLQGLTFGSTISFDLQFSGPALDSPTGTGSGSTLAFSLLNSNLDGAYLTSNQNDGYIFTINIGNNGQLTSTTYSTESGGMSVTSIQAVPEPAEWLSVIVGLSALLAARFRARLVR